MYTYSFLDVVAALTGPGALIALGDGSASADEGIQIEPTGDVNTMTTGADRNVMHSLHGEQSGVITVTLLKTSPTNVLLQAAYNLQTSSGALHGKNTMLLTNKASGDVITCQQVAFKKRPAYGYGKDGGTMIWTFDGGRISGVLGNLNA